MSQSQNTFEDAKKYFEGLKEEQNKPDFGGNPLDVAFIIAHIQKYSSYVSKLPVNMVQSEYVAITIICLAQLNDLLFPLPKNNDSEMTKQCKDAIRYVERQKALKGFFDDEVKKLNQLALENDKEAMLKLIKGYSSYTLENATGKIALNHARVLLHIDLNFEDQKSEEAARAAIKYLNAKRITAPYSFTAEGRSKVHLTSDFYCHLTTEIAIALTKQQNTDVKKLDPTWLIVFSIDQFVSRLRSTNKGFKELEDTHAAISASLKSSHCDHTVTDDKRPELDFLKTQNIIEEMIKNFETARVKESTWALAAAANAAAASTAKASTNGFLTNSSATTSSASVTATTTSTAASGVTHGPTK